MIRSTFAIPMLIALVIVAGLIVALTGDGWRDALSWVALAIPIISIVWAWAWRTHRKPHSGQRILP